jgi:hypothetical protein
VGDQIRKTTRSWRQPVPGIRRVIHPGPTVPTMDRYSELESQRRSIAMANPRSMALDREQAMRLISELQNAVSRLRTLKQELLKLADET